MELAELAKVAEKLRNEQLPDLEILEQMFSGDSSQRLTLEGISVATLIEAGTDVRGMLRRGIVFLKYKKYDEAMEWWKLNRENLGKDQERLHLLILLMESLSCQFAGKNAEAAVLRNRIRHHPLVAGNS